MSVPACTTGPWSKASHSLVVIAPDGFPVADCMRPERFWPAIEANARLISKAPEQGS